MMYFFSGSVSTASTNYWINSAADATNGVWQDIATTDRRYRSQVANDYALFVKDDWKLNRRLTLNLGLRWEGYPSPYIKEGFTSRIANQGLGLFGVHQPADPNNPRADWLDSPGRIFLSGYGSGASASAALACTNGIANPNGIPASTCDPALLTASEFVGPNTPNPDKDALPPAWKNFAPSIGFAWTVPWFGEGKTTMRGGFGMSYITPGRNGTNLETVLGNAPGATISGSFNTSDPQFQPIISGGRVPSLSDLPLLVPVKPTRAPGLPLPITGRTFLANTQAWDPDYKLPYVMNANLSVTRQLRRNMTLDVRYIGSFQRRRDITFDLNTFNVFYNEELFQALLDTRAGKDPLLFDQMFAGLDLHGSSGTGYGPVGSVVNGVYQTGAAHLRRNATFTSNLANGNFVNVINSLYNLSSTSSPTTGTLQPLPAGVTGVGGRVQRNGCDRMANGFTHVQQTAPGVFTPGFDASNATPLRCFAEDYMITNPQFSGLAFGTSSAMLHTNHGYNNYNALQTEFTLRPTQGTSFQATWAFEKIMDFPAPYFNPTWFIDPKKPDNDYVANWATTAHDFRISGTFELPIGPNRLLFGNTTGWVARLLERWTISVIERNTSGLVRDVYGAQMMFRPGGGDRPYPRPDIIGPWVKPELDPTWIGDAGWIYGSPDLYTNFRDPQCTNDVANGVIASNPDSGTGPGQFNFGASCTLTGLAAIVPSTTPGAYPVLDASGNPTGRFAVNVLQNSKPGTQGNFPHSKLQLPRRQTLDANISKSFRLSESKSLQVRVDATNVLNHPNWNEPTLNIQSSNFGRATGKGGPGNRVIQAQMRVMF
jgi:hypothetical protein